MQQICWLICTLRKNVSHSVHTIIVQGPTAGTMDIFTSREESQSSSSSSDGSEISHPDPEGNLLKAPPSMDESRDNQSCANLKNSPDELLSDSTQEIREHSVPGTSREERRGEERRSSSSSSISESQNDLPRQQLTTVEMSHPIFGQLPSISEGTHLYNSCFISLCEYTFKIDLF